MTPLLSDSIKQFWRSWRIGLGLIAFSISAVPITAAGQAVHGLAFDQSGNLFVVEYSKNTIFKFSPDGKGSVFASGLNEPLGLVCDKDGNVFVSDSGSHSIIKFSADGTRTTFATKISPTGLAFDPDGNLFAADVNNSIFACIAKLSQDGKRTIFAKTGVSSDGFCLPAGPAIDRGGNLFVSDTDKGSSAVLRFTPDGSHTIFAVGLGNSAYIVSPIALAVDSTGDLFLSANEGARPQTTIYKFTPNGNKTTFATGLYADGIAVDNTGNVFVSDQQSASILKFTPQGERRTFALNVTSVSPDGQWAYVAGDHPKILNARIKEVAMDLSDECTTGSPGDAIVIWAPDSKRFAFNCGEGRRRSTVLYQFKDNAWKSLESPLDAVEKTLIDVENAQLKKKGLHKDANLRLISEKVILMKWSDPDTAVIFGSLGEATHNLKAGFGGAFLFTLKFDAVGNWKIANSQRISGKEAEKYESHDEK